MKRFIIPLLAISVSFGTIAYAAFPPSTVGQGGTGSTTPSGILYGTNSNINPLQTVVIGSNLTFTGGTLSATGGISSSLNKGNFIVGNDANVAQATTSIFISSTGTIGIGTTSPDMASTLNVDGRNANTTNIFREVEISGRQTTAGVEYVGVDASPEFTAAAGNSLTLLGGVSTAPRNVGGGTVGAFYGIISQPQNVTGTSTVLGGLFAAPTQASSATTSLLYGVIGEPYSTGSGGVTQMIPLYSDCQNTGTGFVGACIGLYLDYEPAQPTKFGQMFGVYQTNPNGQNYFNAKTGIGTTTPYAKLSIHANATDTYRTLFAIGSSTPTATTTLLAFSNAGYLGLGVNIPQAALHISQGFDFQHGIQFGDSIHFYPSAAGTLATDASFLASGIVSGGVALVGPTLYGGFGASGNLTIDSTFDGSKGNIFIAPTGGKVGIASSTPWTTLSIGSGNAITVGENRIATSTSMTIDWRVGNQQLVRTGVSATSISSSNYVDGQKLVLIICNPGTTGGAVTFPGVTWPSGTAPTITTTANKCDIVTLLATMATSTLKIFGGYNQAY